MESVREVKYKVVVANGFKRAGSVWQYEVIRLVMERTLNVKVMNVHYDTRQEDFYSKVWGAELWEPNDVVLMKMHDHIEGIQPLVKEGLVKVFIIFRDPRDAYLSAIRLRDRRPGPRPPNPPVGAFLDRTVQNYWNLKGLPNVLYQRYEHCVRFPICMVYDIARTLEVFLTFQEAKEIVDKCTPKGMNERYEYHLSSRPGESHWCEELDPEIVKAIECRYRKWLFDTGYPVGVYRCPTK